MKDIGGFEISFSKAVNESEFIKHFANRLSIPEGSFWNWAWNGEPGVEIQVNLTYSVHPNSHDRARIVCLFNNFVKVDDLFEFDVGIYLSKLFDCEIVVAEPIGNDTFLRIYPTNLVDRFFEPSSVAQQSEKVILEGKINCNITFFLQRPIKNLAISCKQMLTWAKVKF